ncbi:hypothetical protein [Lysobacter niastensis]|nr:hypothetical protein [Lysobacter niastensis]
MAKDSSVRQPDGTQARQRVVTRWWLCAALGLALAPLTASSVPSPEPASLDRAIELLDGYAGESAMLEQAKRELDAVLKANPDSAKAYREYARYFILSGDSANGLGPMQLAEKSIDQAIQLSPDFAEAYVLRGHLYTLMGRLSDAEAALSKADALGTADPWLPLNWGDLRMEQGRYEEARAYCSKVVAQPPARLKARLAADDCMIDYHRATGHSELIEPVYQRELSYAPKYAWVHGNYAAHLLCTKDDFMAAEARSREALALMEYGAARTILTGALYRKWAASLDRKAMDEAKQAFDEAWSISQTHPVAVMSTACKGGPSVLAVMRASYETGRMPTQTPADAIRRAAEKAPNGAIGMFEIQVVASGRDATNIYLNSEADYRDPRNLTVRFGPAATKAFTKQFGQAPDVALKGKRIAVAGYARQQRIDFTVGGKPTGKYYYQTHLEVTDPKQIYLVQEAAESMAYRESVMPAAVGG